MRGRFRYFRHAMRILLPAALLTLVCAFAAQGMLRHLHRLPLLGEGFSAIFAQIERAPMHTPILPVFLLCAGLVWLFQRGGWRRLLALPLGLTVLLCALFLTRVNGIFFFDVVRTLVPALMGGLL